jgi:hypothetical protein
MIKKGSVKNEVCKFAFSEGCTLKAMAHILGRPALGQSKAEI